MPPLLLPFVVRKLRVVNEEVATNDPEYRIEPILLAVELLWVTLSKRMLSMLIDAEAVLVLQGLFPYTKLRERLARCGREALRYAARGAYADQIKILSSYSEVGRRLAWGIGALTMSTLLVVIVQLGSRELPQVPSPRTGPKF